MSRVDVVPADKGKYKILVNFVQHGVELSSPIMANNTARHVHKTHYPHASLNLFIIKIEEKEVD